MVLWKWYYVTERKWGKNVCFRGNKTQYLLSYIGGSSVISLYICIIIFFSLRFDIVPLGASISYFIALSTKARNDADKKLTLTGNEFLAYFTVYCIFKVILTQI